MKRAIAAVLIVSSLASSAAVRARSFTALLDSFVSPSGNILCEVRVFEDESTLRIYSLSCEMRQSSAKLPPKPSDCKLEWGKHFDLGARGNAFRSCKAATKFNPTISVLPYGKVWQAGDFRCDATTARLRCVNLDKHGFELSRARQILF